MKMSSHAVEDRMDRLLYLSKHVGFGEIALRYFNPEKQRFYCVTTTGVIYVKDKTEQVLITAYVGSIDLVTALYASAHKSMPPAIRNRVNKNKIHLHKQNQSKGY